MWLLALPNLATDAQHLPLQAQMHMEGQKGQGRQTSVLQGPLYLQDNLENQEDLGVLFSLVCLFLFRASVSKRRQDKSN